LLGQKHACASTALHTFQLKRLKFLRCFASKYQAIYVGMYIYVGTYVCN
jgi:hypothetical protein